MQGFNMGRYVPPELEGRVTGNQLHGKRPAGRHGDNRQTVRFEMPFGVVCATCQGHIAQGVRFNANKKKVGSYHSTAIFSFRMRHTVCGGWIEVRTDPQNTAYVVAEGAKKTAAAEAAEEQLRQGPGLIKIHDPAAGAATEDPFARTEKKAVNTRRARHGAARIAELKRLSDRQWADPYERSRKVRRLFRAERKVLQEKAAATEAIRDRAGLAIALLDESPLDAQRAQLVEFGPDCEQMIRQARSKPLFGDCNQAVGSRQGAVKGTPKSTLKGKLKSEQSIERTRETLQKDLMRNTRAAIDPFLTPLDRPRIGIPLHKRRAPGNDTVAAAAAAVGPELDTPAADAETEPAGSEAEGGLGLDYSSE